MTIKESELKKYFSRIGKRGGEKSAAGRMAKLTPERRSEIARNAVRARWAKTKGKGKDKTKGA